MTKEFISDNQDLLKRKYRTYILLIFLGCYGSLLIVATIYSFIFPSDKHRVAKHSGLWEGLEHMSFISISVTLGASLLFFVGLSALLISIYKTREIVVGLKFDDLRRELTVRTKTINEKEFVRTHKYSDLALELNYLSDGITKGGYNTYTLVKGGFLVGHVFLDHFTWDDKVASEIKLKLRNVL